MGQRAIVKHDLEAFSWTRPAEQSWAEYVDRSGCNDRMEEAIEAGKWSGLTISVQDR
jgi:hypothetical protein